MTDNPWREIVTEWIDDGTGNYPLIARNDEGGMVQMGILDGKPGIGPMQLLLAALGGCTGVDIVSIMKKKRQPITAFKTVVRARRADDLPKVWTEIEVIYLIWGDGIDPKALEQAIQLSEEKYCSVGIMLGKAAPIRSSYRILKPGEAA
jgi:putative redox protein